MAESRESQHSLLSADSLDNPPQRSWGPLGRLSFEQDYVYHATERQSEDVVRDIGLGISNRSGDTIPRYDRASIDSSATTTPHSIPKTPLSPHSPTKCPNRTTVLQKRLSWIPLTIFVLALYATIFSGIYLAIALRKPRWSNISSGGPMVPSTANLLSAFFAKTIELAYVTVCVAFLGQVLSRRALMTDSRGISISDMNMRAWIMQPGSMIVHWETLRYSALTFLGAIALVATFVAMLYTTAAQALVAPKLTPGPVEPKVFHGQVFASFGNPFYLASNCKTPVTNQMDPDNRNTTCLQIEHVGHAYHNYQQWITKWSSAVANNNATSTNLHNRPQPTGSLWDNTTVTGSWIQIQNITTLSKKHKRMVNNITMAMPHGGITAAAMDPLNKIEQPKSASASGEGKYTLDASVPSPAINVLCAGMTEKELEPLVYSSWPGGQKFDPTSWSVQPPDDVPRTPSWLNRTVVDDLFEFGPKHGQRPPIFGKYPKPYNTILNTTGLWPANSIYLLGASNTTNPAYVLCSLRAKQTGVCSTRYSAASSGAFLSSICEHPTNEVQYNRRYARREFEEGAWEPDYKNVVSVWANALSLGAGVSDGEASNARLLMQMMPKYDNVTDSFSLDPRMPSIGEGLAVMAGSTLILSSQDAPFVQGWNYSLAEHNVLSEGVYQYFDGELQAVGYASGWTERWQGVFYVILVFAFLTSAVCLGFVIFEARGRQITDFTEPQNLFALAVNSPQTEQLKGACGCGPWGKQLKERWFIGMEEEDEHYYIRSKMEGNTPYLGAAARMEQMEVEDGAKGLSPAVDEFRKVSKRNSYLARFY
ncbi:hypothetical protein N7508_006816 [Penicillium antarcticum]|uniref:uncharacterized protein n=1 Tax=Penicillium antarcticum TaxID=416450 RepID=UPI00239EFD0F|nr:uncharacterized protein N7508_006816 [Penicillium antarcticum]KAJ5301953.1 hypothetical protein N7508_006816 [Penicillium antarcticum]